MREPLDGWTWGMLSRAEIERLAQAIHGLRPGWPVDSLVGFLHKRSHRPLLDITVELAWVAQLPDTRTPARIDEDGPWKRATQPLAEVIQYRRPTGLDCRICSLPESACRARPGDHAFNPRPQEPAPPPADLFDTKEDA